MDLLTESQQTEAHQLFYHAHSCGFHIDEWDTVRTSIVFALNEGLTYTNILNCLNEARRSGSDANSFNQMLEREKESMLPKFPMPMRLKDTFDLFLQSSNETVHATLRSLQSLQVPNEVCFTILEYFITPMVFTNEELQKIVKAHDNRRNGKEYDEKIVLQYGLVEYLDVSNVDDMSYVFKCTWSTDWDLSRWNTSKVKNMESMFAFARLQNGNISNWDVSNVTNMSNMFSTCFDFNCNLDAWNTSKVTCFTGTFKLCYNLNQSFENWDLSSAVYANEMFQDTKKMQWNGRIENWNVSKLVDARSMFSLSCSFNRPISSWDVSNLKHVDRMFEATNFNQPLDGWTGKFKPLTMTMMFFKSYKFNQPVNGFDVSLVTNFESVFAYATKFNQPVNWNLVQGVHRTNSMFSSCSNLQQDFDHFWPGNNHNPEDSKDMFFFCFKMSGDNLKNFPKDQRSKDTLDKLGFRILKRKAEDDANEDNDVKEVKV